MCKRELFRSQANKASHNSAAAATCQLQKQTAAAAFSQTRAAFHSGSGAGNWELGLTHMPLMGAPITWSVFPWLMKMTPRQHFQMYKKNGSRNQCRATMTNQNINRYINRISEQSGSSVTILCFSKWEFRKRKTKSQSLNHSFSAISAEL